MAKKLLMTASVCSHIRNFHLPYLKEFQNCAWETHIACANLAQNVPYADQAFEIPFEKKMLSLSNFRAAWALRKLIRREQYELVITHTSLASFFTRLALKGMHQRPKLVCVMHGYLFDSDTGFFKRQILLGAERFTAQETDLLLLMNDWDYQSAKQYRLARQIEKISGIGVDFSQLDSASVEDGLRLREKFCIPKDAFVLIYPAEFSARKSQHILIQAMANLGSRVYLVLCGEGEKLATCKTLANELKLSERIIFAGQVGNMGAWYRMANALVASSRSEGLPFNVMEAMYCALPVIASAVKGHTDLIIAGKTGLLYPYGDARACSMQIQKIIENAQLCKEFGANAQKNLSQYELSAVMPRFMQLIQNQDF